jgi:glucose-1-phosphate thymidylyltransferase
MDPRGVLVVEDPGFQAGMTRSGVVEALQHVANRPIAHHVLDVLESTGVDDVVVACSVELGGEIRSCLAGREPRNRTRLRYVEQPAPVDLAAGLSLAAPLIGAAPCIAHVASGLLEEPLTPFVQHLVDASPDVVLIVHQGPPSETHLSAATQEMLHIAELDPKRAALGMAGVSLFGPGALSQVAEAGWPVGGDVNLTAAAERIAAAGGTFHVRIADAWRRYAGSPVDLLQLNRIALDRLESDQCRQDDNGNRIEGRVRVHDGASIRESVIVGPAVIGADARIADAYIGPYTSIGADARIEGAEIERSIIAAGASIMHIGCRLAGSVIGQNARVVRDFSLPRAIRLCVADGAEVALC